MFLSFENEQTVRSVMKRDRLRSPSPRQAGGEIADR
jgi:hypothetical protein